MEQPVVPLSETHISKLNMRHGRKKPFIGDILPSIRMRGVRQPLLVRREGDRWGIVAGRRRWFCLQEVAKETDKDIPVPVTIMGDGDDEAIALEASILENAARLDPDQIEQFNAFKALTDKGATVSEIAGTFGVSERLVNQRLAIARLIPAIKKLYTEEQIDSVTLTALTLASKAQQKEWLEMYHSEDTRPPWGREVKAWVLGGDEISTEVALFPLDEYQGEICHDLFGDKSVFADSSSFWQAQNQAVADLRERLLKAGWSTVTILPRGQMFSSWDYEDRSKKEGGEVIIQTRHNGEVAIHKGLAKRRKAIAGSDKALAPKAELSGPLENYLLLHRHVAVRQALMSRPDIAIRLLVAHLVIGSDLIRVLPEPQRAAKEEIMQSVAETPAQHAFDAEGAAIAKLLGLREDETITGGTGKEIPLCHLFIRCLELDDDTITRLLTFIIAETLGAGHAATDLLGAMLGVSCEKSWQADGTFFDLLRDRQVVGALLEEVAGKKVAVANATETIKTQRKVLQDTLTGAAGRAPKADWLPRWLQFPATSYLSDRACALAEDGQTVQQLLDTAPTA